MSMFPCGVGSFVSKHLSLEVPSGYNFDFWRSFLGFLVGPGCYFGVLLELRGADLKSLLGVSLGSWGGRLPAAAKNHQKSYPSAAPGPFWPISFPHLCSLCGVICVFSMSKIAKQTRKSRRTASTDGESLLGKTGLALQTGAIFDGF